MSLASRPASRWAVSARTNGEVLTADIGRSELELVVLGVPGGFSPLEIEGWLHDLAGVAVETSRADTRPRAIPSLMHHALTGLLFSHAELWDKLDTPRPCSSAFVDLPDGAAFGWFGDARVHVLVDGDPVEPQWVRVRDEDGREARAAVFAPDADVVVTLEYWPQGEDGSAAPASLEAEWVNAPADGEPAQAWPTPPVPATAEVTPAWFASAAAETAAAEPPRVETVESARESVAARPASPAAPAPAPASFAPYPELPETLPAQQPGLAAHDFDQRREALPQWPAVGVPELVVPLPSASAAPGERFESPAAEHADVFAAYAPEPGAGFEEARTELPTRPAPEAAASPAAAARASFAAAEPAAPDAGRAEARETTAPRATHPVARWLARVMKWGKPEPRVPDPEPAAGAPVSVYDSLLSESVPPTPFEQTTMDLPPPAPQASTAPRAGGLRPAGIAEVLGTSPGGAAASSPGTRPAEPGAARTSLPAASPSGSIAINEKLQALLREIEAAEAGAMPVISPELPAEAAGRALEIDHEPVGADESFGIPPLPSALTVGLPEEDRITAIPPLPSSPTGGPPEEDRVTAIPPLPRGRVVTYPPPPRPFSSTPPMPAPPAHAAPSPAPPSPSAAPSVPEATAPPTPSPAPPFATPIETEAAAARQGGLELSSPFSTVAESGSFERATLEHGAPAWTEWAGPEPGEPLAEGPPPPPAPASDAEAEPPFPVVTRRARTLGGPAPIERPRLRLPRRPGLWAGGIVAVFVIGWLVGGLSGPAGDRGGPLTGVLRAIGIGGAQFTVDVNSSPGGAQIEIDGKPQSSRTPATLQLPPGEHVVRLVMPGLGALEVPVKGRRGEKLSVDEPMNGSLEILDPEASVPISVSVDGKNAGYAPLKIESIAPGLHEIGFTGPGMPAWAQTVQVEVRGTAQMVARPMTAPANGVIQAQATLNDERGASPLSGAQVYVDGELRGVTPLSIELPRGPHSLRVTWRGETAPVQVIDLPGGNQRFASFNFGLDVDAARLTPIGSTRTFTAGQPKVVSAAVEGLAASDIHEAWLHVRAPEGIWRRYEMTLLRGTAGLVVTSVFPDNVFDKQGATRWYVRVVSQQGDETFSEIQRSSLAPAVGAPARPQP